MSEKAQYTMGMMAPTSTNLHAFLATSWKDRSNFTVQQRAGFAQFVFLMLCAHFEELLYFLIKHRYEAMGHLTKGKPAARKIKFGTQIVGPTPTKIDSGTEELSSEVQVASLSLLKLAEGKIAKIRSQPINELIKSYNEIFPVKFDQLLGEDLRKDFETIRDLRNIFSHGRSINLNFFGELTTALIPDFETFTLKPAVESLRRARILTDLTQYNANNHNKLTELVFSDESLLHFYDATQKAAQKLRRSAECPLELHQINMMADQLPTLDR